GRGGGRHRNRVERRRRAGFDVMESFYAIDPATEKAFAEIPGTDDVGELVEDAQRALEVEHDWRVPDVRARTLARLAGDIAAQADTRAGLGGRDPGKPPSQAPAAVTAAAAYFAFYAGAIGRLEGRQIPLGPGILDYTVREPWGVCGQVISWNYPLQLAARCAAPALA